MAIFGSEGDSGEWISFERAAKILGVPIAFIYRLGIAAGDDERTSLEIRRLSSNAPSAVRYSSVVRFCDALRARYCIPDDRAPLPDRRARHADPCLLPFALDCTIDLLNAAKLLGCDRQAVRSLLREGLICG